MAADTAIFMPYHLPCIHLLRYLRRPLGMLSERIKGEDKEDNEEEETAKMKRFLAALLLINTSFFKSPPQGIEMRGLSWLINLKEKVFYFYDLNHNTIF